MIVSGADATIGLLRWLAAHDLPRRVVLICADTAEPRTEADTLTVRASGCIVEIDLSLPAQLIAVGVEEIGVVDCPSGAAHAHAESWRSRIRSAVTLIADPLPPRRWRRAEVLHLSAIPVSRRELITGSATRLGPLELDQPESLRYLAALKSLGEDDKLTDAKTVPAGGAAALTVTGCVACGVCVQACPTGALDLRHEEFSVLSHSVEACAGGLECVAACPMQAISAHGTLTLEEAERGSLRQLASVATTQCPRCRTQHTGPPGRLCPTCQFKQTHPFGSVAPGEVASRLSADARAPLRARVMPQERVIASSHD